MTSRSDGGPSRGAAPAERIPCPECGKRLKGRDGVYLHLKAKHGGKGKAAFAPQHEPSEADIMIALITGGAYD